jgi:endonuclease III
MSNRAAKYEQLYKSLKKHFKPLPEVGERTVLEHLIYACCLEEARADQADEAFAKLQQAYFDWNEVRVTTVIELGEALNSLPNPTQAGHRIKRCLQSLFEGRYQYDIDDLKKANLGKATDEITAWKGVTPFILNYISQNALGGHAIPADTITLDCMVQAEIMTEAEAEKKCLPGIERAITKSKGGEFASLLHQFAIEFHQNPKSPLALAVFKDLGVTPKPKAKAPEKDKSAASKPAKSSKSADASEIASPSGKPKSGTASTSLHAEAAHPETPSAKKPEKSKPAATTTAKASEATPAKSDTKKPAHSAKELKKSESTKSDAKKSDGKTPAKKLDEKTVSKKPETKSPTKKLDAKKPVAKSEPTKPKASPAKPSPAKAAPKAAGKGATNAKITKKKPR